MRTEAASAMLMAALAAMLLATAAALMLVEARTARAASGETLRLARAQLEAEQLLALGVTRLDSGDPLPGQGVLFEGADGSRVIRQDAAGLVDINAAGPERLAALMTALGVAPERATMLADHIADWRDADDLRHADGAERAEYTAAGTNGPGNRPFETEGEISEVLGMTEALTRCLLPYLTTYSGQADSDPASVPPELRALLNVEASGGAPTGAPLGRVIALTAEAPISAHASVRRTIWLRLTGDPTRPLLIHRAAQDLAPRAPAAPVSCAEAAA